MVWWEDLKKYLHESGLEDPDQSIDKGKLKSIWEMLEEIFFNNAIDMLYFWLGIFTYLYLFLVAFLYIGKISIYGGIANKIVESLAEPYMGTVGIYTILKESRKRQNNIIPKHWGEIFVILWLLLFVVASFLALLSDSYIFDRILEVIITVALSVGIIYVGGAVHRP